MRAKARPRGERVNKGRCCALFGWSRYQFDQHIAEGLPYVRAADHKGEEWVVDTAEVRAWLEERARRLREYHRRRDEEQRRARLATEERREVAARAEREREERWRAELRAREKEGEERRLLDFAYLACMDLARRDLGYAPMSAMPAEEKARFRADWPYERPPWWRPPPGLLEAARASRGRPMEDWPDWRRWWPQPYVPGRPWPWREGEGPADDPP
jgi:phage terminase Nu1 subunit (DNA packaging protein)